jgi:hypothetical protein
MAWLGQMTGIPEGTFLPLSADEGLPPVHSQEQAAASSRMLRTMSTPHMASAMGGHQQQLPGSGMGQFCMYGTSVPPELHVSQVGSL